ncbi:MAG: ACP S-malonyltransferase [Pseudomonadales bacterium]
MSEDIGFMFPGQGSQAVGMLGDLADAFPLVRETFDAAGQAIGIDLWSLSQEGPADELGRTAITQPALLAASVACYRAWEAAGGEPPVVLAGHSVGEYCALVCGGAVDFEEAAVLLQHRGTLMQAAVPEGQGAMAAILGLDDEQVIELCERGSQERVVSAANFNAPGQVVVAGHADAVDAAIERAKGEGARRALLLAVSVPSHCSLMRGAADEFTQALDELEIRQPEIPVVHNVSADVADSPDHIRQLLSAQLYSPVRWQDCIRTMKSHGATRLFECGPGKVLTGLVRRIDRELEAVAIGTLEALNEAVRDS